MASYSIMDIEGIGPSFKKKLQKIGVRTTGKLLERAANPKGRRQLAEESGIDESRILKWANMADLMRIKGVAEEYSELLEAAGVDTVKELRMRNAENLADKMRAVNAARRLTRTTPGAKTVQKWISHAERLSPVITH